MEIGIRLRETILHICDTIKGMLIRGNPNYISLYLDWIME